VTANIPKLKKNFVIILRLPLHTTSNGRLRYPIR